MARWMAGIAWLAASLGLALAVPLPADENPAAEKAEAAKKVKNLVVNGDFEEGDDSPKGWQQIDGLTTFWVKDEDPKRGRVIKVDTDVYQTQAYDWWTKIAKG